MHTKGWLFLLFSIALSPLTACEYSYDRSENGHTTALTLVVESSPAAECCSNNNFEARKAFVGNLYDRMSALDGSVLVMSNNGHGPSYAHTVHELCTLQLAIDNVKGCFRPQAATMLADIIDEQHPSHIAMSYTDPRGPIVAAELACTLAHKINSAGRAMSSQELLSADLSVHALLDIARDLIAQKNKLKKAGKSFLDGILQKLYSHLDEHVDSPSLEREVATIIQEAARVYPANGDKVLAQPMADSLLTLVGDDLVTRQVFYEFVFAQRSRFVGLPLIEMFCQLKKAFDYDHIFVFVSPGYAPYAEQMLEFLGYEVVDEKTRSRTSSGSASSLGQSGSSLDVLEGSTTVEDSA